MIYVTGHISRMNGTNSLIGTLRKTAEDGDGNVGKTIRLITQDKKRTWIRLITQDKKRFIQKEALESTEFQRK